MKEDDKPELNITDDMPEPKTETRVSEDIGTSPIIETEKEPTTIPQRIAVKDAPPRPFKERMFAFFATKKGKAIAISVGILLIICVVMAIPFIRYSLLGVFIKKDVTLTVIDQASKKPISGATVVLGTEGAISDAKGVAMLKSIPVGNYELKIKKKYHQTLAQHYTVPILSAPTDARPALKATGRSVVVMVTNKVSGEPISAAELSVSESIGETDNKGVARLILPVQAQAQRGTIKADNFNESTFEVIVGNGDEQKLNVQLTPKGEVYYLSKRTGTINVMKANLDGSNAKVVVEGTGKEADGETVLLASRDWKYLALLARRDSDKAKLYLVNTSNSQLTVMDEGNASFDLVGWSGSRFVYKVNREQQVWENKGQALKSYYAANGDRKTLDETTGYGNSYTNYGYETISGTYIINNEVVYDKYWSFSTQDITGKNRGIMTVNADGTNKKAAKEFDQPINGFIEGKAYEPGGVYYRVSGADDKAEYYEYENSKVVSATDVTDAMFYQKQYPTYLVSPDGNKTFWGESRDGKNALFVGDAAGKNSRELGISDYAAYGWYTDKYLLVSKGGSELFIIGTNSSLNQASKPLKITDYHKPQLSYPGYGYGYGGQ